MTKFYWLGVSAMLWLAGAAWGQVGVPFFGGVAAYAPQIGVAMSGSLLDVQGTVSADRKYVTINAQPTLSQVISIQSFNINTGQIIPQQGFPGGVNPGINPLPAGGVTGGAANAAGAGAAAASPVSPASPAAIERAAKARSSVLNQRGMIRLD